MPKKPARSRQKAPKVSGMKQARSRQKAPKAAKQKFSTQSCNV